MFLTFFTLFPLPKSNSPKGRTNAPWNLADVIFLFSSLENVCAFPQRFYEYFVSADFPCCTAMSYFDSVLYSPRTFLLCSAFYFNFSPSASFLWPFFDLHGRCAFFCGVWKVSPFKLTRETNDMEEESTSRRHDRELRWGEREGGREKTARKISTKWTALQSAGSCVPLISYEIDRRNDFLICSLEDILGEGRVALCLQNKQHVPDIRLASD